jgi:hypothetical protein
VKAKPAHLQAQDAIVRMHFDPAFAERVRRAPEQALPGLPESLRAQLAALDPRALKLDRLRGRRLLRTLFDEYKASTTIVLAATKRLDVLDGFFASPFFDTVFAGTPLYLAYAGFLMKLMSDCAGVVAIEMALATSRRSLGEELPHDGEVWCAPGVKPVTPTTRGDLAAMQQAEQ